MLEAIIKEIYDTNVEVIKAENNEREMPKMGLILSQILGCTNVPTCYAKEMASMKEKAKSATPYELDSMLAILESVFYFSYGHDMAYKKKIEADCFMHEPIDSIIMPEIQREVKKLFNDVSVMIENPDREENLKIIEKIISKHIDFNSLLFLLYVNDWQFHKHWRKLYPNTASELDVMIENSTITIGDFLNALVDYKIAAIRDVVTEIQDSKLRTQYLAKIGMLAIEQKAKIDDFTHTHLPVGYFKHHTILDFLRNSKPTDSKIIGLKK